MRFKSDETIQRKGGTLLLLRLTVCYVRCGLKDRFASAIGCIEDNRAHVSDRNLGWRSVKTPISALYGQKVGLFNIMSGGTESSHCAFKQR